MKVIVWKDHSCEPIREVGEETDGNRFFRDPNEWNVSLIERTFPTSPRPKSMPSSSLEYPPTCRSSRITQRFAHVTRTCLMCTGSGSKLSLSGDTTSRRSTKATKSGAWPTINGSGMTVRMVSIFPSRIQMQSRCSDSLPKCHRDQEPGKHSRALTVSTGKSMINIQIITMGTSDDRLVSIRGTIGEALRLFDGWGRMCRIEAKTDGPEWVFAQDTEV